MTIPTYATFRGTKGVSEGDPPLVDAFLGMLSIGEVLRCGVVQNGRRTSTLSIQSAR